ncbi:PQQ-binding-like beta-propeller repeat protein [Halosolutus halophilus]|uniref:outer membrane protein assembly factor BamB family protein n=1 Tax=Halosolutus halophilus TaxID=1552990 RepID=UPI002235249D|nr:PQQ-binding-like beta-propeller repeat protein [Halosolutus halophilus]
MPSLTRRQVLATIGSASGTLAGCLSSGSPSGDLGNVGGDWPMDGSNPGHTRRVDEGPAEPTAVWETDLDGARGAGTPSVVDGHLYVPVDAVSDEARHRHRLHSLSATTGEERWRVPLRSDVISPPAIYGDRIVVSAQPSIERGRIVAFQRRHGDEAWLYDVDARLTAPPTVADATVYVPDWNGRIHALSVGDGSIRWSRRIASDGSTRTFAEPIAVNNGVLYLGSQSGATGVIALDAETGEQRWSRSTEAVTTGPVVADDFVVIRTHRVVVAFDAAGTRRWSFTVPESAYHRLALGNRHVYVPARGSLYAIDRSGAKAWSYDSSDSRIGPPTVVGDDVVIPEADRLTAVSRADGTERWTVDLSGAGDAIVTPGAVFTTRDGGRVVALGDE